jgi:hypothetical protein
MTTQDEQDEQDDAQLERYTLRVESDISHNGAYGVVVFVGPDESFPLRRSQALAYASAAIARATEADHSTAIMRMLTERLEMSDDDAYKVVTGDMRPYRGNVEDAATRPVAFVPAIGRAVGAHPFAGHFVPMLLMRLHDQRVGELTPEALRRHAVDVMSVLAAVNLDMGLRSCLIETMRLDKAGAEQFVVRLAQYMPVDDGNR